MHITTMKTVGTIQPHPSKSASKLNVSSPFLKFYPGHGNSEIISRHLEPIYEFRSRPSKRDIARSNQLLKRYRVITSQLHNLFFPLILCPPLPQSSNVPGQQPLLHHRAPTPSNQS